MAIGVPETAVFAAADRVLARGARPTVERVRAELGRGSPARVGQLLEVWWDALTQRLAGELRLPELPAEVATAFRSVWGIAVAHGCQTAEAAVAEERIQLQVAQDTLAGEQHRWQRELDTAVAARQQAEQALGASETRLMDMQCTLEQQSTQLADLQHQRDHAVTELVALRKQVEIAHQVVMDGQKIWNVERHAIETSHRADQDRWLKEVDRARQEAARLGARLAQQEKASAATREQLQRQIDTVQVAARRAEQGQAASCAKTNVLEGQVRLLHAQLAKAVQYRLPKKVAQTRKSPAKSQIVTVLTPNPLARPKRSGKAVGKV